jgi:mRNA-degrading endonuclease RelE of RelBE toxin-antitoxin system
LNPRLSETRVVSAFCLILQLLVDTRNFRFAETPLFAHQAERVWSDAEREEFVDFIAGNPEAGDLIPETGGVRKVRWSRAGSGKRGGARVIYFHHDANQPLYLLLV